MEGLTEGGWMGLSWGSVGGRRGEGQLISECLMTACTPTPPSAQGGVWMEKGDV